jgi:putative peptidoglycan lipid II flippase
MLRATEPPTSHPSGRLDGALLRGMALIALFSVIAGVARIGQDVSIAWRFGTGPVVDAYYFVISLVNWPVGVALSVLTLLAVPADAALRGGREESTRLFRAELLGAVLLISVVSLPMAWWALRAIAGGAIGGLEPATAGAAVAGVPGLVASVSLGLTGALLSAWFVARSRHVLTLLEALPPLLLIAVVLAIPGRTLFWGTTTGIAVQVLVMALLLRQAGELPAPRLGLTAAPWHSFTRGAIALVIGHSVFSMLPLIDAFFAARLGEGTVAALSFANRLVLGLMGLAGLALQRSGLPLLSGMAIKSPDAAQRMAFRWAAIAAAIGTAMTVAIWLVADMVVPLLFERGNFSANDSRQVADLLRYGLLQIPAFLAGMVMVTALAALQATRAMMFAAFAGLSVKLLLSIVLSGWLGAPGLQLATALMYVTTAALCWLALRRIPARATH